MKIIAMMLMIVMSFSGLFALCGAEEQTPLIEKELLAIAEGIIKWKSDSINDANDTLYSKIATAAGSTAGDWYAFALARLGKTDGANVYADHLKLYTEQKYSEKDRLSPHLSTEWHRITITSLALGKDPTSFGKDENGKAINLIRDGVYDRGLTADIGSQGISGYIWGLIALDSLRYEVPKNAYYTRESLITALLERQLPDGGFALAGKISDPDVTSMAVIALSTYINDDKVYEYTQIASGEKKSSTVYSVIETAVNTLSKMQTEDGEYRSYGRVNVKSACQVAVALCSVGVSIFDDARFIKNGQTLLDVIMRYKNSDGGFLDEIKTGAESNSMSGEQVLYTLSAVIRFLDNERKLFDMREEFGESMKARLVSLNSAIEKISDTSSYDDVYTTLESYFTLPESERDYVFSYVKLKERADALGIDSDKLDKETEKIYGDEDEEDNGNKDEDPTTPEKPSLTEDEISFLKSLSPEKSITTEHYSKILILKNKLYASADFEGKDEYLNIAENAVSRIEVIRSEIAALNADISAIAHPLEEINTSHRESLAALITRYEALSDYDKQNIEDYEGLLAAYTKANTEERADVILYVAVASIVVLALVFSLRIAARRKKKRQEENDL